MKQFKEEHLAKFNKEQRELIEKAYLFSKEIHENQKRKSGEDYLIHPLTVAKILSSYNLDAETIAAGLLHDTVEDGDVEVKVIEQHFGSVVANLVEGVTNLGKIDFDNVAKKESDEEKRERKIEGLRKLFLAMAGDLRVVLIKLADRLHNMRTLEFMDEDSQKRIALETMEVYSPLANRLGMGDLKGELETLSFKYLFPTEYTKIVEETKEVFKEKEESLKKMENFIGTKLAEAKVKYEIGSRAKQYYSIYKKLKKTGGDLSKVYDLMAIRIIVQEVEECYKTLGIIHSSFKPLIYRIKDYIAVPKPNGYRSLHTTVFGFEGKIYEIQIRTKEMHEESIGGVAAHWHYDEKKKSNDYADKKAAFSNSTKLDWVKELLNWQETAKSNEEFIEGLKIDVFKDRIFVFSPKGDVYDLPEGATPVDFAFSIHSEVGTKLSAAKVNGKIFPIDGRLENRDIVEIITSKASKGPKRDWLNFVITSKAKHHIKLFLKQQNREENLIVGKKYLEEALKERGTTLELKEKDLLKALEKLPYKTKEDAFVAIGETALSIKKIANLLVPESNAPKKTSKINLASNKEDVIIMGQSGVLINLANCCNPTKGDKIAGFITRGRGVTVHKRNCKNILKTDAERIVEASWGNGNDIHLIKECTLYCKDRMGLLRDITGYVSAVNLNISSIKIVQEKKDEEIRIELKMTGKDNEQFKSLSRRFDILEEVISYSFR